ncbi:MAG: glycosyltransferase family 2 protein [Candidatus Taylorbacteria bacterium]
MKISVIIPAHNEEAYILRTLQAILDQSYGDYEVIIVDNVSTDRTFEIVTDFVRKLEMGGQSKIIFRVTSEGEKGTMAACEKGRLLSTGDIIARLDADCLPDSDWLEKAARIFENEKVVAVSGPYAFYDAGWFFSWSRVWQQKIILGTANVFMQWIGKSAVTNGGNSLFRATTLEAIGGFDRSIVFYGDDTNIAKRMAQQGKVVFSPTLVMKTSARRFMKEGRVSTQFKYVFHFFKESFSSRNM